MSMEQFMENTNRLSPDQRRAKFDQIIAFLRQHNAHAEAECFYELRIAYPKVSYNKAEEAFRQYMAWCELADHQHHRIVQHIFSQG
jgi:hypothetical protein